MKRISAVASALLVLALLYLALDLVNKPPAPSATPYEPPRLLSEDPTATPMAVAATVNGLPIYLADLVRLEDEMTSKGLIPPDVDACQYVLDFAIRELVIRQEATSRQLRVSDQEASDFLALIESMDPEYPSVMRAVSDDISSHGLTYEEYASLRKAAISGTLLDAKLGDSLAAEVTPPSHGDVQEAIAEYTGTGSASVITMTFPNAQDAAPVWNDLVNLSIDAADDGGFASELIEYVKARPGSPQSIEDMISTYTFTATSSLPQHIQDILDGESGGLGITEEDDGTVVISLLLAANRPLAYLDSTGTGLETAVAQELHTQNVLDYKASAIDRLVDEAAIEILIPCAP